MEIANELYWCPGNTWYEKGDTITWESRGFVHTGIITKMNRKTTEVVAAGATPFGLTVTKVPNSMITGIVEHA